MWCTLQEKWFADGQLGEEQLHLLKALPIFKAAYQPRHVNTALDSFVDLVSQQRFLAPAGTDPALLTDEFITARSEAEAGFLCNRLGVQQVDAATFLDNTVFSR